MLFLNTNILLFSVLCWYRDCQPGGSGGLRRKVPHKLSSKEHKPTEKLEFLNAAWSVLACRCLTLLPRVPRLPSAVNWAYLNVRMNERYCTNLLYLISTTYSTSSGPDWPRAVRADPDGHQRHPHPPHPAPLLDSLRQGRWKWTQWGNGNDTEKDYLKLWLSHSAECRI